MPKKNEVEKMLGAKSAADAVKERVKAIKLLSEKLSRDAIHLTNVTKSIARVGPNSARAISMQTSGLAGNFDIRLDLITMGTFTREDKLILLDQITELVGEYMRRECAATYEEIQKLGKEL